jgi:alpha/beta superfamily hydrolase
MADLPAADQTAGTPARPGDEIRATSVLPARRRSVTLHTADGLRLQGDLAVPEDRPPSGTLVCLHPLPTHGGSLDSHVYRKAAWRLPALAGIAVLRFNFRGTGGSDGEFDEGNAERYDLAAALDLVEAEDLPAPWLVGWSFGSELVLAYGPAADIAGGVLISPPLHRAGDAELAAWADAGKPLLVLVPEHDDYLRPDDAAPRFARVPECELIAVGEAKHLFVGERFVRRVLDEIVARVAPDAYPLPTTWPATEESA